MAETDEEIVGHIQAGNAELFGVLIDRYEAKLLRYGRKFIADAEDIVDLVQDVFIKAYTNIQGFDTNRAFSPWIYRIAHNTFVNALRQKKKEPLHLFDFDTILPQLVARERADEGTSKRELKEMLDTVLGEIDVKYKEPLILYYFEEMSYGAIAEVLHIPESTVGVRLRRGRVALKKQYEEKYG